MTLANHPHLADLHGFERHFPETWREEACQYLLKPYPTNASGPTRARWIAQLLQRGVRPDLSDGFGGSLSFLPNVCRSKWGSSRVRTNDGGYCGFTLEGDSIAYVEAEFALYLLERDDYLWPARALLSDIPSSRDWF